MWRIKEFLDFDRNPRVPCHQEDLKLKGKVKSVEYRVYTAYAKGEALIKGRTKSTCLPTLINSVDIPKSLISAMLLSPCITTTKIIHSPK